MYLQDILDQLTYGELREIALGTGEPDEDGGMPAESINRLFPLISLGLTELHKRFLLREADLTVALQDGKVTYVIASKFAQSNTASTESVKYINDTDAPFENNLMKIERIIGTYNEKAYEIPLNVVDNPESIRLTSQTSFILPDDPELAPWLNETTELRIVYRADHPELNRIRAVASPTRTEIHLPVAYLEPLLYYVASRVFNSTGMTAEFHDGNNYASKFEAACQLLRMENHQLDRDRISYAIERNGWV